MSEKACTTVFDRSILAIYMFRQLVNCESSISQLIHIAGSWLLVWKHHCWSAHGRFWPPTQVHPINSPRSPLFLTRLTSGRQY
jgi:hypothetical protein